MEKHSLQPQYDAIIVPAQQYDLSTDDRQLIPFIRYDVLECKKIGFVNRKGEVVVKPQYDMYSPGYKDDLGYIKVAKDIIHQGRLTTLYGLIDSTGEIVLPLEYRTLLPPIDSQDLYMVQDINYRYGVVRSSGEMVVPFGEYNWIDGFDRGLARVIGHDAAGRKKWGVIDETGELVVPMEYDSIRNFYGKNTQSIPLVSGKMVRELAFADIVKEDNITSKTEDNMMNEEDMWYLDDYGREYGEYAGSYAQDVAGYSDDVINDAFEGDPEIYWNID